MTTKRPPLPINPDYQVEVSCCWDNRFLPNLFLKQNNLRQELIMLPHQTCRQPPTSKVYKFKDWTCTVPRGGMYWVVHPRRPRDFQVNLKGRGKSQGRRKSRGHLEWISKYMESWSFCIWRLFCFTRHEERMRCWSPMGFQTAGEVILSFGNSNKTISKLTPKLTFRFLHFAFLAF